MDAPLAAALAGSAAARGRFLEGDGRRRLHGEPAERRLQHRHRHDDGGERCPDGAVHGKPAEARHGQRADPHLPVSPRRDPEGGREGCEVRERAVTAFAYFVGPAFFAVALDSDVFTAVSFGASNDFTGCVFTVPLACVNMYWFACIFAL